MNKVAKKNTIMSVVVMSIISVVCVALLAVCNAFIPKFVPTLDLAAATLINSICPSGVDDQTALNEGYFVIGSIDDKKLAAFNKENRVAPKNELSAVYKVVKGDYKGTLVIQSQAKGYADDPIVLMTAIGDDGAILAMTLVSEGENSPGTQSIFSGKEFNPDMVDALMEYIKGKTEVTSSEIIAATGATSKYSVTGVVNALNMAVISAKAIQDGSLEVTFEGDKAADGDLGNSSEEV